MDPPATMTVISSLSHALIILVIRDMDKLEQRMRLFRGLVCQKVSDIEIETILYWHFDDDTLRKLVSELISLKMVDQCEEWVAKSKKEGKDIDTWLHYVDEYNNLAMECDPAEISKPPPILRLWINDNEC
jgi:hypothetical protein